MAADPSPQITPYLLYRDVDRAVDFLTSAFGFEQFGETLRRPDGTLGHAAMKLGEGVVMMGCPGADYRNPKQLGSVTQSVYVIVDDVDRHFERAKAAGAQIIEQPTDTRYGARRYGAADPEGHHWYFAQNR
jgi:PhnB protein